MSSDVRSMFDRTYLGAWDLQGREVTVQIKKVSAVVLVAQGNKKNKRPVIWFERTDKAFALNKTNANIIAGMYGYDAAKWVGQPITIFPTTTKFGSETVDCIRVKPVKPSKGRPTEGVAGVDPDPEMRARQDSARASAEEEEKRELAAAAEREAADAEKALAGKDGAK